MKICIWLIIFLQSGYKEILLPITTTDRKAIHTVEITQIGKFGIVRKARTNIPQHLHTGIDIKRPNENYINEYIYPITSGVVISKRTDGPYAQLIIEHNKEGELFWTVYEHIAGIEVELYQPVKPNLPIARFFNHKELNTHGWQFDHFHFEVLKKRPISIRSTQSNPERLFTSYTLSCFTENQLQQHFYDPLVFLDEQM
ncbi:MAG: M23 family metallopeptidase [Cyclobacteriaceae bacterium]|nr:M23 family metallopeptidase [Cyclobacteriaceae bacterium]